MTRKWSARSLGNLAGIHPDLRRVMDRALQESPVDFIVIEGLRDRARQTELVKSGASRTMNSRHLTGHAVDILPIGLDGKGAFDWVLYRQLAPAVKGAAMAENVPLDWGGDWKSFRDGPHFELNRAAYPAGDLGHVTETPKSEHVAPVMLTPVAGQEPAAAGKWQWLTDLLALIVAWFRGRG